MDDPWPTWNPSSDLVVAAPRGPPPSTTTATTITLPPPTPPPWDPSLGLGWGTRGGAGRAARPHAARGRRPLSAGRETASDGDVEVVYHNKATILTIQTTLIHSATHGPIYFLSFSRTIGRG